MKGTKTKHIHDFVNDLQPVRVVVPIYVRLIRWMIVALVTIGVCLAAWISMGSS